MPDDKETSLTEAEIIGSYRNIPKILALLKDGSLAHQLCACLSKQGRREDILTEIRAVLAKHKAGIASTHSPKPGATE